MNTSCVQVNKNVKTAEHNVDAIQSTGRAKFKVGAERARCSNDNKLGRGKGICGAAAHCAWRVMH